MNLKPGTAVKEVSVVYVPFIRVKEITAFLTARKLYVLEWGFQWKRQEQRKPYEISRVVSRNSKRSWQWTNLYSKRRTAMLRKGGGGGGGQTSTLYTISYFTGYFKVTFQLFHTTLGLWHVNRCSKPTDLLECVQAGNGFEFRPVPSIYWLILFMWFFRLSRRMKYSILVSLPTFSSDIIKSSFHSTANWRLEKSRVGWRMCGLLGGSATCFLEGRKMKELRFSLKTDTNTVTIKSYSDMFYFLFPEIRLFKI
jgi:hypothetical protein